MSKTISYLRFPLAVAIVMEHFAIANNGFPMYGVVYGLNQPDWYSWLINFFAITLAGLSVPLFFIFSGYFFFYKCDFTAEVYVQKLKKRFQTLFVPYVLWNTLAIILVAIRFLPVFSSILPGMDKIQVNFTLSGILHTYFDNFHQEGLFIYPEASWRTTVMPIDGPLWFVRDLMTVAVLSPILYWLIKKLKGLAVVLWGIIAYIILPYTLGSGYIGMLCDAAFFFSWGAYYSIMKKNIVMEMRKLKYAPLVYLPIAIADTVSQEAMGHLLHYGGIIVGIVAAVAVASYLIENGKVRVNRFLSESSFFIYAFHMLFIWELGKVIFALLHIGDNTYALLAFYFSVVFVAVLICLGIYAFLKRYLPYVCSLLTGGR